MISAGYMLDTNIVSDMVRNPEGRCIQHWKRMGYPDLFISAIVASELFFGIEKKQSSRLTRSVESALARLEILPYESPADRIYGKLRASLERSGYGIGAIDLLIAAHARSLNLTLVTDNVREFSRVDGLRVENWLEDENP